MIAALHQAQAIGSLAITEAIYHTTIHNGIYRLYKFLWNEEATAHKSIELHVHLSHSFKISINFDDLEDFPQFGRGG